MVRPVVSYVLAGGGDAGGGGGLCRPRGRSVKRRGFRSETTQWRLVLIELRRRERRADRSSPVRRDAASTTASPHPWAFPKRKVNPALMTGLRSPPGIRLLANCFFRAGWVAVVQGGLGYPDPTARLLPPMEDLAHGEYGPDRPGTGLARPLPRRFEAPAAIRCRSPLRAGALTDFPAAGGCRPEP